jgi:hypothetical protein
MQFGNCLFPAFAPPDLDLIKQEKQELFDMPCDQKGVIPQRQQRERR